MITLLLLACGGTPTPPPEPAGPPAVEPAAVVVFVRHAEKAKDGTADPPLTDAGQARADCLADVLAPLAPARMFTSEYTRTKATLAPAAAKLGLESKVIAASDDTQWLARLRASEAGTVTVVAAHSNTIPAMVEALGGRLENLDEKGHIPESEYNRMVHLTLDGMGRATSTHVTHFCIPDPAPPAEDAP